LAPRKPIPGLYDAALTTELEHALAELEPELKEIANLDREEAPRVLARLVQQRLVHALNSFPKDQSTAPQLALTNELLKRVAELAPDGGAEERLAEPARKLLAVRTPAANALGTPVSPQRPVIPLSTSDLIVNGHHDISLAPEVKRELASADGVDLLCSFLKWSGLRLVLDELKELLNRKPNSVRVLTTAYMSATERRALDELQAIGAQLRVSYDTEKTRLHAKAWLFHRQSGFSTGYIGSSNLSAAAMLDGLEWNVRLSTQDNKPILEKFRTTFEQYWADTDFRPYVPEEFDEAVKQQRDDAARPFFVVDVIAKPHQQEILDDLAAERDRGHHRNLVVAATGTGKTIVAALDYRRLREKHPTLLFVAHRKEILEQSLYAFRAVLREGSFGELLVGEHQPVKGEHVFASIQSLSQDRIRKLAPDAFEMVIVDEFHHAAAESYEEVLAHLKPKILLGLTATPERADGKSVLHHFDGRIASELRLWKALDQGLLSPFHYFGVGGPDLTGVRWANGRYVTDELSNVYTANDAFALRVRQELQRRVRDVHSMRALGFCVDIAHAEHMARKFSESGLAARAVSAATSPRERDAALAALKGGSIQVLFSVDLFNEGVDLPDVDTVMFLRPTESATVFLQQLGRGLRKSQKKECLTVLDFIGNANRKFRFDQRFRAVVGGTRREILREVQQGFPSLPSGCVIELDRQSQESVLENIKAAIGLGRRELINDLKQLGPETTLTSFLERTELEPEDLYGDDWSFSRLRRAAGFETREPDERELQIERALARLLHVDDRPRLEGLLGLLARTRAPAADAQSVMQRWLWVALGYAKEPLSGMAAAFQHLWSRPSLKAEITLLLQVLSSRSRWLGRPLRGRASQQPLQLHARYSVAEVMAALGATDKKGALKAPREGVFLSTETKTEVLFVTLEKSERDYTPTTLYDDYPISRGRFHWQSQSRDHEKTQAGLRYLAAGLDSPTQILLLVRERAEDRRGETMTYLNLGPVIYRSHRGARPMSVEWELAHDMPASFFQENKRAAG
jgi:superfamily II DNA or RNA helicase/HKD family nuclease